jgi:hypothetical protein
VVKAPAGQTVELAIAYSRFWGNFAEIAQRGTGKEFAGTFEAKVCGPKTARKR